MTTLTLTLNEQSKEGNSLLVFLKSLNFVNVSENETMSGKQAALDCETVPLDTFISELHHKVDQHFSIDK